MVMRSGAAASSDSRSHRRVTVDCLPDDVILVVSSAGWCCKSCNTSGTFRNGDSVAKHMYQHHHICIEPSTGQSQTTEQKEDAVSSGSTLKGGEKKKCDIKTLTPPETPNDAQKSEKGDVSLTKCSKKPVKRWPRGNRPTTNSSEMPSVILGPRQRKRTARALESESQNAVLSKRTRNSRSAKWSNEEGTNPQNAASPLTSSAVTSDNLALDTVNPKTKPGYHLQRQRIHQRKFAASAKLKQKYGRSMQSEKSNCVSVSDLKDKYFQLLNQEELAAGSTQDQEDGTLSNNGIEESSLQSRSLKESYSDGKLSSMGSFRAESNSTKSQLVPHCDEKPAVAPDRQLALSQSQTDAGCHSGKLLHQHDTGAVSHDQPSQGAKLHSAAAVSGGASSVLTGLITQNIKVENISSGATSGIVTTNNIEGTSATSAAASAQVIQKLKGVLTASQYHAEGQESNSTGTETYAAAPGETTTSTFQTCDTTGSADSFNTDGVSVLDIPIPTSASSSVSGSAPLVPSTAPKSNLSNVTQDDAQTLELVTGALQELQDNLLAMPPPAASATVQQISSQENNIHISELVLTDSCPPMQQFEQHVARIVQQNEPQISANGAVCYDIQQPDQKPDGIKIEDLTSHSLQESGAVQAENAYNLTEALDDIKEEKNVITEEDVDKLLMPKTGLFMCEFCRHGFSTAESLQEHVDKYSTEQPVQCKVCHMRFHSVELLNIHIYHTHETDSPSKACFTCGKTFTSQQTLLQHIVQQHAGAEGHTFHSLLADAKGMHECIICKKKLLSSQANLERHYKRHSDSSKQHKCPACGEIFHSKQLLLTHLQNSSQNVDDVAHKAELLKMQTQGDDEHEEDENTAEGVQKRQTVAKYHCNLCGIDIWNVTQVVRRHLLVHARKFLTKVSSEKYLCSVCGRDVNDFADGIMDHFKTHRHIPVRCRYCKKVFSSHGNCARHEENVHRRAAALRKGTDNPASHKSMCEICGKMMYSKYTLQKHVKLHGEEKSLFSCDKCPRSFHYRSQLLRHQAKHSPGSSHAMTCQHCGKPYMHKKSLDRHIQVDHMGVKDYPHKCKQCPAQFFDSVQLRDHIANKHQNLRPYKCPHCAESFVCRPTLTRHMRRTHEGCSPYVCKVCNLKFVEKTQLLKHQVVHTGIEPFQCSLCPKSFTRPRSLRLHMNLHNDVRPFPCEGCDKAYVKRSHMERHRKKCKRLAANQKADTDLTSKSGSEQHQRTHKSPNPAPNLTQDLNIIPTTSSVFNSIGTAVIVLPPGSQIVQ